jgi:hypothetical protein
MAARASEDVRPAGGAAPAAAAVAASAFLAFLTAFSLAFGQSL